MTVATAVNRIIAHEGDLYRSQNDCSGAFWTCTGAQWSPDDTAIALIVGVMLIVFVVGHSGKSNTKVSFGSTDLFEAGQADRLARNIAKDGPVFYRALTSGGPDIYLQHVGADAFSGWHAFEARVPGSERKCTLVWQPPTSNFLEPCSRQPYPADGTGLIQYRATVDKKGALIVDLGTPLEPSPTTTTSTG